jgi:ATP-dependent exoDNAse (exonuclease V) alpha subunit
MRHKRVLITDEIGMCGKKRIRSIDSYCKVIYSLPTSSGASFGGLPLLVSLGDFHQFPPVRDRALWAPNVRSEMELWHRFDNVVILTESMRQQGDCAYQELLRRVKNVEMTQEDVNMLNERTVAKQLARGYEMPSVTLCQKNNLRARTNREQITQFAKAKDQKIFLFVAKHEVQVRQNGKLVSNSLVQELLAEDGEGLKGPGVLMYTTGMPVVLLNNMYTPGGLVNGLRGKAVGVVHDPNAKMVEVGGPFVLCDRPPLCILVQHERATDLNLPHLEPTISPIFPFKSSRTKPIDGVAIHRTQIPLTVAWATTVHKAQGASAESAVIDANMAAEKRTKNNQNHKKWSSLYVQFSRLRSLNGTIPGGGLWLLNEITLADTRYRPDPALHREMQRLEELERATTAKWQNMGVI